MDRAGLKVLGFIRCDQRITDDDQPVANLPKPSVANVTQVLTIDKTDLAERIGRLSPRRGEQILAGLRMVTEPRSLPQGGVE